MLNLFAPLTGSASYLQYPGCWIRDQLETQRFDLTAQDAANLGIYNEPILQRIESLATLQTDLRKRLSRLHAERAAFPMLMETARFMCRHDVECEDSSIDAKTLLTSPVLGSSKSLEMVDEGIVQTRAALDTTRDHHFAALETLRDTRIAQHRLHRFSQMPHGCQITLSTKRLQSGASVLGISIGQTGR